jgi:hypothetical protein
VNTLHVSWAYSLDGSSAPEADADGQCLCARKRNAPMGACCPSYALLIISACHVPPRFDRGRCPSRSRDAACARPNL